MNDHILGEGHCQDKLEISEKGLAMIIKNIYILSFFISLVCIGCKVDASNDKTYDSSEDSKSKVIARKVAPSPSQPQKKPWNWTDYAEASAVGAMRGLAGFPLEHPFDRVKTTQQATRVSSGIQAAKIIYQQEGMRGFYKGALPNSSRYILKPMYRYPLMFYLPHMYGDMLPKETQKSMPSSKKVLTGLTIAGMEVYVICPLERIKVLLMTSGKEKNPFMHFLTQNKGHVRTELFRGLHALFPKQVVSWTSFLVADDKMRQLSHQWSGIPIDKELPFWILMGSGAAVGVVNTTLTLPFDYVKTHLQQRSAHDVQKGLLHKARELYNLYGAKAFYSGWRTRMLHYILNGIFTVTVIEKFEKR